MANRVLLNSVTHRDVRVDRKRPAPESALLNVVGVVPREFVGLLQHYPIFFTKNTDTGQFEPAALLGFATQENLFFSGELWDASYIPMHIQRLPFSLVSRGAPDAAGQQTLEVALDLDQTVTSEDGVRLFGADGQPTEVLQNITSMLSALVTGVKEALEFAARLAELNLIEPVQIKIEFVDRSETSLQGLYWIAAPALKALPAAQLAELRDRQYLEWMYYQMASISHMSALVARKNRILSGVTPPRPRSPDSPAG